MKPPSRLRYVAYSLILLFTAVLIYYRAYICDLGYGDTAFLTQLTDNIALRGKPVSQIAATFDEAFARAHFTPGEVLCNGPLPLQAETEFNYFKWHAYSILYLIAPLTWLIGGKMALSFLHALAFAALPCIAYLYLRRQNVSLLSSLLVSALIIAHPAWSVSIQGQLYADRLFVGIGFLYFLLLGAEKRNDTLLLILLLLGSTISERYGLVMGSCTIMFLVLSWTPFRQARMLYISSATLICISLLLLKVFIVHPQNAAFASSMTPRAFFLNFKEYPGFAEHLFGFMLINAAFAVLALRSWRIVLLAVFAALPNMIGNVGGVEKGQYLAHYHSTYFPILAAALVLAVKPGEGCLGSGLRTAHLFLFLMLGHETPSLARTNIQTSGPVRLYTDIANTFSGYRVDQRDTYQAIKDAIPAGSVIVAAEYVFPTLYPTAKNMQLYPLGLDEADYLVVPWQKDEQGRYFFPASFSRLGAEECRKQDALIAERLRKRGVDMDNPQIIRDWAIIKLR